MNFPSAQSLAYGALDRLRASMEAGTPLSKEGGQGNDLLDVPQRGAVIGDVVPIVFARRIGGTGGVLISPPATEARFDDSLSGDITASYHLVLSEGLIDSLQVRDVFQRSCRVGSFTQTYDKRAGTFLPGNFINNSPNLEAPTYCGTGGTYTGLSTMAFSVTIPAGFDYWNRQVHCFVRGGLHITRLLDSTLGPSNNVADLLLYLLRNSSRVPDAQIDTASLLTAATFTNVNGFWFNGVIQQSTNLRDWASSNLQYFLLRLSRTGGKESLTPLLPINANGTIKTTAVDWEFTFTEDHIISDSFEINYVPLADRKPFVVLVLWRQQDDLGIPLIRTAEVRYTGTAEDGPFEQHDLSEFCTSEDHAVKAGTYILSRRNHITHQISIGVKPDAFNGTLAAGDLVRVRLDRTASTGAASAHDYLYEVDRIGKSITGEVRLSLTHFPVDDSLASVVAKEVDAAVGAGFVLPTGLSGITCDVNSSADTSVPADTSLDPDEWDIPADGSFDTDVTELDPVDLDDIAGIGGGSGGGDATADNPGDGIGAQEPGAGPGITGTPEPGNTLTYDPGCPGAYIEWRLVDDATGNYTVVSSGVAATYIPATSANNKTVVGVGKCPDSSSPTGYGPEITSPPLLISDGFIPLPSTITVNWTRTVNKTVDFYNCDGSPYQSGPETPNIINGSTSNVVSYKIGFLGPAVETFTCGGTPIPATYGLLGFSLKLANGTILNLYDALLTGNPTNSGIFGTRIFYCDVYLYTGAGIVIYDSTNP